MKKKQRGVIMNKRAGISVLFGLLFLISLVGLVKVAVGELDTNVDNTKVEIYGEPNDNITSSDGGVSEIVNFTIATTTGGNSANITNITIYLLDEGNYTINGIIDETDVFNTDTINESTFSVNSTILANGTATDWNCYNLSLYLFNCENNTALAALDPSNSGRNSIIVRFNVSSTTALLENVVFWNVTTTDTDGVDNSTLVTSYLDSLSPRILDLNITDGNVTWQNNTEMVSHYEVDGSSPLTVNVNIREMNPTTDVYILINNSGTNASIGPHTSDHVWRQMTQSISPGLSATGVYTYTYTAQDMSDAVSIGNFTNFIIVVNDTYNNIEYVNGSRDDPFAFTTNTSLVEITGFNLTTEVNDVLVTLTNPSSDSLWVAEANGTIDIVVAGKAKGDLLLYFREDGTFNVDYANGAFAGAQRIQDITSTNNSAVTGEGNVVYTYSIDFAGNTSNNPTLVAVINSSQSNNLDTLNLHNYSAFATYTFKIDGSTGTPTITPPSTASTTISDSVGLTYTCNSNEAQSGVKKYTWTLTKPDSTTEIFTDTTTSTSASRAFSGTSINQAGTYSIKCRVTDNVGNEATSIGSAFSANYATTASSSGSGGGGSTGTTPTVSFDVDFSEVTTGSIKAQQGLIKSFSFDGSTKHTITFDKVTATSATVTIASTPMTVTLNVGQTKEVDINLDGVNDVKVKLKSVVNGLADVEISKIEAGAQVVAKEEKAAAGIPEAAEAIPSSEPIPQPVSRSNAGLWITLLVVLAVVVIGYLSYRKK